MSNAASQDRRRQRSSDDGTEAETSPLAVALLRQGLSDEQIVQDGWTALFWLPQLAVNAIMAAAGTLTDADRAALEGHATLDVLKVTPSSPQSCELWCRIVVLFSIGVSAKKLLGCAEVRDALVALQHRATTAACEWWCRTISYLTFNNSANRQVFGTGAVRDALVAMHSRVTTADACKWWCGAICNLTVKYVANQRLFGTSAARDALVALSAHATTADACQWWCTAVCHLTVHAGSAQLFGTAAVRDALVAASECVSTVAACRNWCRAVSNIVCGGGGGAALFTTAEVRDALVALSVHTTTADACECWCSAICALTANNAANQQLFGTAEVCGALVALHSRASTTDRCYRWCNAICNLTANNAANTRLFGGTAEVRDALVALQPHVTTTGWNNTTAAAAVFVWCVALAQLATPGANRILFRVAAVRAAHATLQDIADSDAGASKWWHVAAAVLR
jgi:hypothetical protein